MRKGLKAPNLPTMKKCLNITSTLQMSCLRPRTKVYGASFKGMDLKGIDIRNSTFVHCDFKGCNLTRAILSGAHFKNCDLSDCIFHKCIMFGTTFRTCILDGISVRDTAADSFSAYTCTFKKSRFDNVRLDGACLQYCDFSGTIKKRVDEYKAVVEKCVEFFGLSN